MNTIEMMNDWVNSGCNKEYLAIKNTNRVRPLIARNNGFGVLIQEFTSIEIHKDSRTYEPLYLCKDNLNTEWIEMEISYTLDEAIEKYKNGCIMVSLSTSKEMCDLLPLEEVNSRWKEKVIRPLFKSS